MDDYPESAGTCGSPIVVASNNRHKIEEFRRILEPLGLHVSSPDEIGLSLEVEETGGSFRENANLKAAGSLAASGLPSIADDSGLVIDVLGGEPGIYSARYGGPGLDDVDRNRLVLERLRGVPEPDRAARFVCAIVLVTRDGNAVQVEGVVDGQIAAEPRGWMGFGYDPIFYFPPAGKTFGEMTPMEKDAVSHRGIALRRLAEALSGPSGAGILR